MMTDFRLCPKCRAEQQGEPEQEDGKMVQKRKQDPQPHLPGMAPKRNKAVHAAAELFADLRAQKGEALKKMNEAQQDLIDKMVKAGFETYEFDGVKVKVKPGHKVNCRISDPDKEGDGKKGKDDE